MPQDTPQKTILIVDDSLTVRKFAEKALSSAGYSIFLADSGATGIAIALEKRPDLILLDYTLGEELGTDVCRAMGGRQELANIPIVLMSAKSEAVRAQVATLKSIVDILSKPFVRETLLSVVEHAIHQAQRDFEEIKSLAYLQEDIERFSSAAVTKNWDPQSLILKKMSQVITSLLRDRIAEAVRTGHNLSRDKLARAITEKVLDGQFISNLAKEVHELADSSGKQGFAASARTITLPDLLQSLANNTMTGVLTVLSPRNVIELHLFGGKCRFLNPRKIGLPHSDDAIYADGYVISMDYARESLEKSETQDDSLYFRMLEDGLVEPEQLPGLMVLLGIEILCECVADVNCCWYQFRPQEQLDAKFLEHSVDVPVQKLMLKLFSHIDEWKAIVKEMDFHSPVYVSSPESMRECTGSLTERQIVLLTALDGRRTPKDLCKLYRRSLVDVYHSLHCLFKRGLIKKLQG
jgi:DNA-binding response OmpR family regulator